MATYAPNPETDVAARKRRLTFRASHRGTREADLMIGGFVAREVENFSPEDIAWFEDLLEENDVDIMAWMTRSRSTPEYYDVPLMHAMQNIDFVNIPR
jgi:antitoxin CptB